MEILSVKHKGYVNKQGFGKKAFFNLDFPAIILVVKSFISNYSPQSWRSCLHLGGVASIFDRLCSCQGTLGCAQSLSVPHLRLSSPHGPSKVAQIATPQLGWVLTWQKDQILLETPPCTESDSSKLPSSLNGHSLPPVECMGCFQDEWAVCVLQEWWMS